MKGYTETRLDLLYICPTYKQFHPEDRYNHLMLLHVRIQLLVKKYYCRKNVSNAQKLLKAYVSKCHVNTMIGTIKLAKIVGDLAQMTMDIHTRHDKSLKDTKEYLESKIGVKITTHLNFKITKSNS